MPRSNSTDRPTHLDLTLDPRSPIPLYLQLKHHVVHLVSSGAWAPGMPVPSVRNLAAELGLAAATVQRAYGELQAQGVLVGQVGRGVYVAELAAGVPDLRGEQSEVLTGVLARAVAHARSLGFREDEIVAHVRMLVGGQTPGRQTARVVFVGIRPEFVDKYKALLAEALADLSVEVDGVTVGELQSDGDAVLDALDPIVCVVSLVGTFAEVRRLAGHRGTPVYGIVLDLTQDTQQALMQLTDEAPLALVAEDHYMQSARALVREYRGTEQDLLIARHSNRAGLARAVRQARVIIHTFGSVKLLEKYVKPGTRLIELRYEPNAGSLTRLRVMLTSLLSQRSQAEVRVQLDRAS